MHCLRYQFARTFIIAATDIRVIDAIASRQPDHLDIRCHWSSLDECKIQFTLFTWATIIVREAIWFGDGTQAQGR